MDSANEEEAASVDTCKRTNGDKKCSPRHDEEEEQMDAESGEEENDSGERKSETGTSENGTHPHRNDSNNNPNPSEDKQRSTTPKQNDSQEEKEPQLDNESKSSDRVGKEVAESELESNSIRPKNVVDAMSKSSFTSELINNIRNSRNLLGNSHNELAEELTDKNKEVSV